MLTSQVVGLVMIALWAIMTGIAIHVFFETEQLKEPSKKMPLWKATIFCIVSAPLFVGLAIGQFLCPPGALLPLLLPPGGLEGLLKRRETSGGTPGLSNVVGFRRGPQKES